jgi:magnesium-transporting ATPase (P-type)
LEILSEVFRAQHSVLTRNGRRTRIRFLPGIRCRQHQDHAHHYDIIILGEELERTSDAALQHIAEETTVFARVSPMQKHRIIHALRHRGHVVGYMGDGINDAPSLHAAT